jgi:hypothetical protein
VSHQAVGGSGKSGHAGSVMKERSHGSPKLAPVPGATVRVDHKSVRSGDKPRTVSFLSTSSEYKDLSEDDHGRHPMV